MNTLIANRSNVILLVLNRVMLEETLVILRKISIQHPEHYFEAILQIAYTSYSLWNIEKKLFLINSLN